MGGFSECWWAEDTLGVSYVPETKSNQTNTPEGASPGSFGCRENRRFVLLGPLFLWGYPTHQRPFVPGFSKLFL